MQLLPEKMMEIGMVAAGVVGLLILIAPNFGLKPKETVDGWCFPVKPTCLLLYYLALTSGIGAVGYGATRLLASGTSDWIGWACFGLVIGTSRSVSIESMSSSKYWTPTKYWFLLTGSIQKFFL